jgi:microcystin degradation protein MlrC
VSGEVDKPGVTANASPLRIAIMGFDLETNAWAPSVGRPQFEDCIYLVGPEIAADLACANPRCPLEIRGFVDRMRGKERWEPIYIFVAGCGGAGPIEQGFLDTLLDQTKRAFADAGPVDAVYIAGHGAAVGTENPEPDATLYETVRACVGDQIPIVATLDLHALVSPRLVKATDLLCAYRTNPHVDQYDRGGEAADALAEMLGGIRTAKAFIRVPILPPQTALLTSHGPYAEAVAMGRALIGPQILNVSVCGNFSYADSPRNGIGVLVSSRGDQQAANDAAVMLAEKIWSDRWRYVPKLTPLDEALRRMQAVAADPRLPALAFADVADNPGGGASGSTAWLLEAFHGASFDQVALGVLTDAALAAEAHSLGVGASFTARFNRDPVDKFSLPFAAQATVVALSDGVMVGRRGTAAGQTMNLGRSARLDLSGMDVVVISIRQQMLDPVQLEHFGIDIAKLRGLIVKSRGHFRAGFDEFFGNDQVLEVDVPGMVTPVLTRVPFRNLARPIFPFDPEMSWEPHVIDAF